MCGRITLAYEDWTFMYEYFGATDEGFRYPPHYNIAPTQPVVAVIGRERERKMGLLKWGLIPHWSETEKPGYSTFNARAESLQKAPAFRGLIQRRRCVVVADGFYEWQTGTRKPYRIQAANQAVFGLAGLWDTWTSADGNHRIHSCTVITCEANSFMQTYHNRMPVVLSRDSQDRWLNPAITDARELMGVLKPFEGEMHAYRVPEMVGNVRNEGPECIQEVL